MRVFNLVPHPSLRPCIDRFWGWECGPAEQVALPVLLPGTGAEMFFHHGAPFQPAVEAVNPAVLQQNHLLCVRRRPLPLAAQRGIGFVAIRFRAGRLGRLMAIPTRECPDLQLPAEELWGNAGRELAERVAAARDFPGRVALLEDFLLRRLESGCQDALVEAAVDRIYRNPQDANIALLADSLGIGRRQLERRFLQQEGISPAEFRRVTRFQKGVRRLMLEPSLPVLDAALDHGYYDQAHFCRDFKSFCGRSPACHLATARRMTHFYNTPRT